MNSASKNEPAADSSASSDPMTPSGHRARHSAGRRRRAVRRVALGLFLLGVPLLLLVPWVAQPHVVVGDSMAPALRGATAADKAGDIVTVNRWAYLFSAPARWTVIVFDRGEGRRIKRVIGLPGETVEIRSGALFVDGRRLSPPDWLQLPYLVSKGKYGHEPLRLGAAEYCVVGDNSYHSKDSRIWGALSQEAIIGECVLRVWPPARMGRVR